MLATSLVGRYKFVVTRLDIGLTINSPCVRNALCNNFNILSRLVDGQVESIDISEATSSWVINLVGVSCGLFVCFTIHIPCIRNTLCYVLNIVICWLNWGDWEGKLVLNLVFALIRNFDSHRIFGSLACYHINHSGFIPLCQSNLSYIRKSIFEIVVDDCINGTCHIRSLTDGEGRSSTWDCS